MHAHRRRTVLAAVAALAVLTGACAVPAEAEETSSGAGERAADPTVGAPGVGDPYFPRAGNGGIDVRHYDLRLDYRPPASPRRLVGHLDGVAEIRLRTTQRLSRFDLDLRGLRASRVRVDGRSAAFSQADGELRIRPARTLAAGRTVVVRVAYAGRTGRPEDSSGALYGWVTTPDGAVVASEPDGASTWFPANDHPTDKARFDVRVRVPRGLAAISNGVLRERDAGPRRTTWTWRATDPMPAYLATVAVGDFSLRRHRAAGVPVLDAVDRDLPASASRALRRTGEMLDFFEGVYGRYPFATYGAIVDDDELGYALETQTRSLFTGGADEATVAHELAHQWVGNHVGPARWSDIWLNEGWATYSEWLWDEHDGGPTVQSRYDEVAATPADDDLWSTRVADPGVAGLFEAPVYVRGAAALHALRTRVGDERFFELARAWVTTYGGRTASTADLEALAERVTGQELTAFFDAWLRTPRKPAV